MCDKETMMMRHLRVETTRLSSGQFLSELLVLGFSCTEENAVVGNEESHHKHDDVVQNRHHHDHASQSSETIPSAAGTVRTDGVPPALNHVFGDLIRVYHGFDAIIGATTHGRVKKHGALPMLRGRSSVVDENLR